MPRSLRAKIPIIPADRWAERARKMLIAAGRRGSADEIQAVVRLGAGGSLLRPAVEKFLGRELTLAEVDASQ